MISVMQWIYECRTKALHDGDEDRLRLADLYFRARDVNREATDQKLAIFCAGGDLARQLDEPWWAMFYEFWKISTLLVHQWKVGDALDLVTRAVLEVAKPLYDGFPGRPNLNLLLVSVYMEIDPIWHEARIRATFDYLRECDSWLGFPAFLAQQWAHFLDVTEHPEATAAAWEYLRLGDEIDSDHYRASALLSLCKLLDRSDPDAARTSLDDFASQAESYARKRKNDRFLARSLMWRAFAARQSGDEVRAHALYESAHQIQSRLATPHNAISAGALAFHVNFEEWDEALRVCQAEIHILRRHQQTFQEAKLRFKKCELLQLAGRDTAPEIRRLRSVAARLPSQQYWECEIENRFSAS